MLAPSNATAPHTDAGGKSPRIRRCWRASFLTDLDDVIQILAPSKGNPCGSPPMLKLPKISPLVAATLNYLAEGSAAQILAPSNARPEVVFDRQGGPCEPIRRRGAQFSQSVKAAVCHPDVCAIKGQRSRGAPSGKTGPGLRGCSYSLSSPLSSSSCHPNISAITDKAVAAVDIGNGAPSTSRRSPVSVTMPLPIAGVPPR